VSGKRSSWSLDKPLGRSMMTLACREEEVAKPIATVSIAAVPTRRLSLILAALPLLVLLAACGPLASAGLSASDKVACKDASQDDAVGVYQDGANASNSDIRAQAARITQTSDPSTDEAAVKAVLQICKSNGYALSAGTGAAAAPSATRNAGSSPASQNRSAQASATPVGAAVTLPAAAWTPAGTSTSVTNIDSQTFGVSYAGELYWGGLSYSSVPGCDYRFAGDAKLDSGGGYAPAVRAALTNGTPTGIGFQYDPGAGGYRLVQYPDQAETGPVTSATTDSAWHSFAIDVQGTEYHMYLDNQLLFSGTTSLSCGGLFIRTWGATNAEFRDLTVTPLSG